MYLLAFLKPPVLSICIRIRTRNLGKEKILLLIKHTEPHFPFGDDSLSSRWVEKRESRKSFLTEAQVVTGIPLQTWCLACSRISVCLDPLSLAWWLKQLIAERKRVWSPKPVFKHQCYFSLAVCPQASHFPSLSPRLLV